MITVKDDSLHNRIGLEAGLNLSKNKLIDLMIMCAGIKSPGTISEVIRGYIGDKNAKKIFTEDQLIMILKRFSLRTKIFDLLSNDGSLRPFELASLRLMNMIEVLSKWNIYMIDQRFLTQRGATFLLDEDGDLLYSYRSKALLDYSETMSTPLQFLDKWL